MSRFNEIEAFIQVTDLNSFTLAADKLQISRSRVSQLVASLEIRLGVQLMVRTTRTLTLTPEGEQFYEQSRNGIRQLAAAEANLKLMSTRLSGPVRINAIGGIFGENYLADALSDVVLKHPELQMTIDYTSTLIDLNKSPVDLIMRIGAAPGLDVNATCLGDIDHTLCASPKFLNQHGFPKTPDNLLTLPLVCGTPKTWELQHMTTGEHYLFTPTANWRSGNTAAQSVAIEKGLGIGRLLTKFVQPKISEGILVPVLPEWQVTKTYLWLLWPKHRELSKRVHVVREHIEHWFSNRF